MPSLIYPQLVGKRIQKIEEDREAGLILLHTKDVVLHIFTSEDLYRAAFPTTKLKGRDPLPEPLVIPAKN